MTRKTQKITFKRKCGEMYCENWFVASTNQRKFCDEHKRVSTNKKKDDKQ